MIIDETQFELIWINENVKPKEANMNRRHLTDHGMKFKRGDIIQRMNVTNPEHYSIAGLVKIVISEESGVYRFQKSSFAETESVVNAPSVVAWFEKNFKKIGEFENV